MQRYVHVKWCPAAHRRASDNEENDFGTRVPPREIETRPPALGIGASVLAELLTPFARETTMWLPTGKCCRYLGQQVAGFTLASLHCFWSDCECRTQAYEVYWRR